MHVSLRLHRYREAWDPHETVYFDRSVSDSESHVETHFQGYLARIREAFSTARQVTEMVYAFVFIIANRALVELPSSAPESKSHATNSSLIRPTRGQALIAREEPKLRAMAIFEVSET